ncbi:transcription termination/antitermination NusG family protein [Pseudovibrio sp. POLY-S9]|uniref:transcription termination/antitermination NusG family protein n=1 Tax=Pseudovibrio sp. POLY-S9 TaxID=1576596 RepID=UPI000708ED1E|nr:transcription termination/antitermination NusG family protein [Pseudovibrio sp. POLY-S9]
MNQAPNAGNRALELDYNLLRALIKQAPLEWVVVQTNPNCEDRAKASVAATGAVAYLPMLPKRKKVKRSAQMLDVSAPMFPRYLFVGLDVIGGQSCDQVRICVGVEKILAATKDAASHRVPIAEMLRMLDASCEAQIGRKNLHGQLFSIGCGVVLTAGSGALLKGVVREVSDGGQSLRVDVEAFGRTTKATVTVDKVALR